MCLTSQQKRNCGCDASAELPEPVWAAALAANWDRKVKDLVHDIYGDHRYMVSLLFVVHSWHVLHKCYSAVLQTLLILSGCCAISKHGIEVNQ